MFSDTSSFKLLKPLDVKNLAADKTAIEIDKLNLYYGQKQALHDISMRIPKGKVTAFIGPSGCGKSTIMRSINRMNDLIEGCKITGNIRLHGHDVYAPEVDVSALRRRVGMVFQKPNPFPKTVYENVIYGLRLQGVKNSRVLDDCCERSLRGAGLWDEVKNRLHESAFSLSAGQQQRLVVARAIAIEPEVLLLDEPTSTLDPISTLTIEELINELKTRYTVVIVTHNMQQAARVSDYTAFVHMGKIVEYRDTDSMFTSPKMKQTEDYITGRIG
ncbi:phosphate transport ATP-binding protein pstB [Vibrio ishigakensis]|uniref:Phosphate transport ATP-binding protein pstB n=1 Tax=Vibrio ishigakensis TaxID=1481914 RepID=A0A0B8PLS4_9VIBR|nr:phosphate ABC transporter ATP-binding protein PstB [Vibrio ishigakensis]GAM54307.1 phosphate transport ATP-binding protein pstB [Vibrio ishigakensis]GAM65662.1 phosphate transport ATP-binding protein pstB [Vibrio ishigakensis]GAM78628.1 phosphate transport ATP-binding protein pstB [Vibrio ishigakensis]